MDKIILGILMMQRFNVYEIRSIIKKNFQAMCSDSLGGIQAALKKLMAAGMVTYQEYMEKSVNKKQYSITDSGRQEFLAWLHTPANLSNPKNMELGKLLFMGFVPIAEQLPLLDEIIATLEKELSELLELQASIPVAEETKQMIDYYHNDPEYCSGVQSATQNADIMENVKVIASFNMLSLQYGIDLTKFQIDWFYSLRKKAASGAIGTDIEG